MRKNEVDIRPYVRQFYKGNGFYLFLALVQIVLSTVGYLMISWLLQQVMDLIAGENVTFTLTGLFVVSLIIVLGILATFACDYFSKPRFLARAMEQYKSYAFEQLSKKSISAFSGESTGLYISALSNDASSIESGYLSGLFGMIEQIILLLSALVMMFWYSPLLTLISMGLSLFPVMASLFAGNRLAQAEKRVSDRNEAYMSSLRDSLVGFSVVKSFRAERQMCKMFAENVRRVADAEEKRRKISTVIQMMSTLAGVTVQLGVFLVGAYLALSGRGVTAGTVLIFVQLLNYVLTPIGTIPNYLAQRKAARVLIGKLAGALSGNVRKEGGAVKASLTEGIVLRGVSFGYEPEKTVLRNVDVTFRVGGSYVIVGASGSGKSTLLNLLMASCANYTGDILYDDTELRQIGSESLYGMVSVIQQSVFVFNASIRDNITMFSDFPAEQVDRAIALSGLSALVAERGEDYLCGENGCGLSGGEKQRISIARSLLKKAQVLLVDEATAALDVQTAFQVSDAILDLEGLTRIVVTHSLDEKLLRRYDCVLTLKNGQLAEVGTFDELMAKKGYFYSLFTVSQA